MTDFTEFVVQKFNGLAEKFAKKNGQYAVWQGRHGGDVRDAQGLLQEARGLCRDTWA